MLLSPGLFIHPPSQGPPCTMGTAPRHPLCPPKSLCKTPRSCGGRTWVQHATVALQVPGKPKHPQSACCRQGAGRGRQGSLAQHCLISETVQSLPWHEATHNGFSSDNPSSPLNSIKTIRED